MPLRWSMCYVNQFVFLRTAKGEKFIRERASGRRCGQGTKQTADGEYYMGLLHSDNGIVLVQDEKKKKSFLVSGDISLEKCRK